MELFQWNRTKGIQNLNTMIAAYYMTFGGIGLASHYQACQVMEGKLRNIAELF